MRNIISQNANYAIYPGTYVSKFNEEEAKKELKILRRSKRDLPAMNVTEMDDSFKVEVAAPGAKREEFLVYADGNILHVGLIHNKSMLPYKKNITLKDFDYSGFDRRVVLPKNTDPEFMSAEYKEGTLRLLVPKTKQKIRKHHTIIAVY